MSLILIKTLNLIKRDFIVLNFYFQNPLFMFIMIRQFIYSFIDLLNISQITLNKIILNHYILISSPKV